MSDTRLTPRSAAEIAARLLALLLVIDHAHAEPGDGKSASAERVALHASLSELERDFIDDADSDHATRVDMSWRAEAVVGLLWCLGLVDDVFPLRKS